MADSAHIKEEGEIEPEADVKADGELKPTADFKAAGEQKSAAVVNAEGEQKLAADIKEEGEQKPAADVKAKEEPKPAADVKVKEEPTPEADVKAKEEPKPAADVKVKEEPTPEADVKVEGVTKFLNRLVCQLCNEIFEEDIPIACVHLTFCRSCLGKYGLHQHGFSHDMVCTRCLGISFHRNPQSDSQQDILSLMHLLAKCKRGLLTKHGNPAEHSLFQQLSLSEVPNIAGDNGPERPFPAPRSQSPQGATSSSTSSLPGSSQPTKGGTTRCTPKPEPGQSPGKKGPPCSTCDLVKNVSSVTGPNETVHVVEDFSCDSKNVIYYITCEKCQISYVGQTSMKLKTRITQHRYDIKHLKYSINEHFNLPDHTIKDHFRVCVLKSVPSSADMSKEEDEMIIRLGTIENGMNIRRGKKEK